MKFRLGLLIGVATGYYFGTKAGRERYRQLRGWVDGLRRTDAFETAADKAKAAVELGVERAKDVVESKRAERHTDDQPAMTDMGIDTTSMPVPEVTSAGNGIGG